MAHCCSDPRLHHFLKATAMTRANLIVPSEHYLDLNRKLQEQQNLIDNLFYFIGENDLCDELAELCESTNMFVPLSHVKLKTIIPEAYDNNKLRVA